LDDQPDLLQISSFYQQNGGNFWVALADGEVVGTIALIDCGEALGVSARCSCAPIGVARNLALRSNYWKFWRLGLVKRASLDFTWAPSSDYKPPSGFMSETGFDLLRLTIYPQIFHAWRWILTFFGRPPLHPLSSQNQRQIHQNI
jgi:hypothetical protein